MVDADLQAKFGATVRYLRNSRNLSQEEFAVLCGLHRTYIGSIERGEKNVTLLTAKKLANVFGMKLSELLAEVERS
jgi:transcriptional regulator with XRE-family HTH domain